MIVAHGLGANKSNFLGTVDLWHQLDYNVLIFDFRGHGKGDPLIHWTQTERLYENAQQPKQVAFLNTEGHFGTMNDPGYVDLIKDFISKRRSSHGLSCVVRD